MPKLSTTDLNELVESIIDNFHNGNRTDALEQFKTLNTLQAGYAAISINDCASITDNNKRWLMNAMYNG